jgi:hypothetical protein
MQAAKIDYNYEKHIASKIFMVNSRDTTQHSETMEIANKLRSLKYCISLKP